jgi:hypothetical protein
MEFEPDDFYYQYYYRSKKESCGDLYFDNVNTIYLIICKKR